LLILFIRALCKTMLPLQTYQPRMNANEREYFTK
jgi:hypothetical protein